uniref:FAD/NAD(P)-binding domain-containing protein n=1 Tax=candidate division WOR-3 bacterium TaxID=2052148 RepID=A0A7C2K3W6_UNCW3
MIFAIGQIPEVPLGFMVKLKAMGTIEVDPFSLMTSRKGIFACGDVVTGTRSVVEASAMGRRAALSVGKFLGGDGL